MVVPGELRVVVAGDAFRRLARRKMLLAAWAVPILVMIGVSAVVASLSLTLVAVLCAFFAYFFTSVALRQEQEASAASDAEIVLRGDRVLFGGQPTRRVVRVIDRPGYMRFVSSERRVVDYWFDSRRDPSAFVDILLRAQQLADVRAALGGSGIPVRRERSLARAFAFGGALALLLCGFFIAKVTLGLAAVVLVTSPIAWIAVAALAAAAIWLSRAVGR